MKVVHWKVNSIFEYMVWLEKQRQEIEWIPLICVILSLNGKQCCRMWLNWASPSYECVELSERGAGGCSVNLLRGNKGICSHILDFGWSCVPSACFSFPPLLPLTKHISVNGINSSTNTDPFSLHFISEPVRLGALDQSTLIRARFNISCQTDLFNSPFFYLSPPPPLIQYFPPLCFPSVLPHSSNLQVCILTNDYDCCVRTVYQM